MLVPPRSPSVFQTPARQRVVSSEMPLPANHPHARKQSVQLHVPQTALSTSGALSLAPVTDPTSSLVPPIPLAPSPLSQSMLYNQSTPVSPLSPSPFQTTGQQPRSPSAPPPKLGLGIELSPPPRPSVSRSLSGGPRTPPNFNPPGYETLLWAYAQLSGTVELDPAFSRPEAVRHLAAKLAKRPVGGGSLDLKASTSNSTASSPLGGLGALLGFGSPSSTGTPPGTPSRSGFLSSMFSPRPTPIRSDGASSSAAPPGGLTTFEPPQSLLAVDLALAPGESKSCKPLIIYGMPLTGICLVIYRVTLPSELPPTFRGRALRFSYQFIVGTCRGGPHMENQTRLLKIPLRVYNHIPGKWLQTLRPFRLTY
jgi:RAB6A-GEF complex partner protein 2